MMRRVGTEQHLAERKKKTTTYIGLFMLGILVLGTVGYSFASYQESSSNPQSQTAGADGRFKVDFEGQTFYLTNSLEEVKNISVETSLGLADYSGKTLYVSSKNKAIFTEAYPIFSRYAARIQEACYGTCGEDLPEKNCSNNLLVWKDGESNRVYQENNCVFIEGDLKAVDAFVYKLAGMR